MTTRELIAEHVKDLSQEKQQEVLDFVEFLKARSLSKHPLKNLEGLWAGHGIDITSEDIDEARREMWGNFAREDP